MSPRILLLLAFTFSVCSAQTAPPPTTQDFSHEVPADVTTGPIILRTNFNHRAVDGSWVEGPIESSRGAFEYRIDRAASETAILPHLQTKPLVLNGYVTSIAPDHSGWDGTLSLAGKTARVHFQLTENKLRGDQPPPTYRNVAYGPYPRNVLDVYLAKSTQPTPIAVHIHGGAWMVGDKGDVYHIKAFLDAGISVISINYRYCPPANPSADTPAVALPLLDAARAIQFIRSRSAAWHLRPDRLGIYGISAGACTALWLAAHPDLAQPNSPDPVLRQSSVPTCVAPIRAQTSLDPQQMRAWVGPELTYGAQAFGISTTRTPADFARFLAVRDRLLPWIAEYSPAALLSRDGPPIFLDYLDFSATPCEPLGSYFTHSPGFGTGFTELAHRLGRECHLAYAGHPDPQYASWQAFLVAQLTR